MTISGELVVGMIGLALFGLVLLVGVGIIIADWFREK